MLEALKIRYNPKQSRKRQMEWCRKTERNVSDMLYGESLSNTLCFSPCNFRFYMDEKEWVINR